MSPFVVYYLRNLSSVDDVSKFKAMIIIVAVLGSITAVVAPNLRFRPTVVAGLLITSFAATSLNLTQNPPLGWWLLTVLALAFSILIAIPFWFLNWLSLSMHNRRAKRINAT